ncbi:MAG TPA: hypothetical protein VLF62_01100 [Candidatus Saccharimonadales bacterium]|nr:hypothetical protein [Candidatus Saccharimonadales bacterium]
MFGHDDNAQVTQDAAAQGATTDSGLGVPAANNMDVTTVGADAQAPAQDGFSGGAELPATVPEAEPAAVAAPAPVAPMGDDPIGGGEDLLQIKQQALQQLSPLVGHLDQTPEEKFRTTMMMIQASDNQELIKDAYTAAQSIEDEKTRAQALLDIINEINYFTQQHQA